ncbi:MAG: ankyrin repeat domain-containing protein [Gammaproteobacteria bacterium]|nr:ankyrin repeat domain-containing protein [Gammaproteobacteria bacterium]
MVPRFAIFAAAALALFVLAACTTQLPDPPPDPTVDLFTAAAGGNIAELAANKRAGSDLDALSPDLQITPLTMAAVGGQVEAAQWLLDNGADVNGKNGDGGTALTAAAFLGHVGVAKVLIDGGIDTSARNWEGQSAADLARFDWDATEYILIALVRPAVAAILQLEVDRGTIESGRAKILAMLAATSEASTKQPQQSP